MASIDSLFEEASLAAREELAKIDLDSIHELGISKTHTDLLGSHTVVTYPPLDALQPIDGDRLLEELEFASEVDSYVHIPFCEYPCKFCPYTTLNVNGSEGEQLPSYSDALKAEMTMWAEKLNGQGARIRSLFVGGGTPFAIHADALEDLLSFIRSTIPFTDDPEICVETSPRATLQSDAQRKLEMLKDYGITRMSIGVQSFDFASLRDMARTFSGHTKVDEETAVRILLESGIPNINVDMIQDLPLLDVGYEARLKHDLTKIAELKPQHVTWYNMRLRPETTYARRDKHTLVTEPQSLHTRIAIWTFMEAIGYTVLEGDRFALQDQYEDNFRKTRGSVDTDLLGMGVSSYSHVSPGFFQNPRVTGSAVRADSRIATREYIRAIAERGHAITYGFPLTDDEILAGKFALGLKKGVSHEEIHEILAFTPEAGAYGRMVLDEAMKFVEAGLLEVTAEGIGFSRTGRLFENEICAHFYSPRVVFLAHQRRGTLTPEIRTRARDYATSQMLAAHAAGQTAF